MNPEKPVPYFIAIVPPDEVSQKIISVKKDFSERFGSKAALRIVPHITLKSPFKIKENKSVQVTNWFHSMPVHSLPFEIELMGFGCFPKSKAPVIFIQPRMNNALAILQKEILDNFISEFPESVPDKHETEFHPHVTVAYRDLNPILFEAAWKEYQRKPFTAMFPAEAIHLFQHNNTNWQLVSSRMLPAGNVTF